MTQRIRVCPHCGNPSAMQEIQGSPEIKLLRAILGKGFTGPGWASIAFWCAPCEMPFVEMWPVGLDRAARLDLVGLPRDMVRIEEERGKT